jgi:isocitrate/isopropylmalate dehydrogenase
MTEAYGDGIGPEIMRSTLQIVQEAGTALEIEPTDIIALLQRITHLGLDFIKCEHLRHFDGEPSFALGQGQ